MTRARAASHSHHGWPGRGSRQPASASSRIAPAQPGLVEQLQRGRDDLLAGNRHGRSLRFL
jgi:hypothetical protein